MLKRIQLIIISLLLILILTSCSNNQETISIGVVGTMTGIHSDLAVSGRRGVEIAVKEVNESGGINGKKIILVVKDDKNDANIALQVNKDFINEGVSYVIGHYTSGMQMSVMDYITKQYALYLSPTVSADALNGENDNFLRFIASTKEQAQVLNKVALQNNHKKFAILMDSNNMDFNTPLHEEFIKSLVENGGEILIEQKFGDNLTDDLLKAIEKIKYSDTEAVFVIGDAFSNAFVAQQLRLKDVKVAHYAPLWANTRELFKTGGASVNGMYIVGGIDLASKSERYLNFAKTFEETYGNSHTFASLYSYETAGALFAAIKATGDERPLKVKEWIINTHEIEGLQDTIIMDQFGDTSRAYGVYKISNGFLNKVH